MDFDRDNKHPCFETLSVSWCMFFFVVIMLPFVTLYVGTNVTIFSQLLLKLFYVKG